MKIDFKSLAFGYKLTIGGGTPAWETALGQGQGYKINNTNSINELVKGMIYKAVSPKSIRFKKGKGGAFVRGDDEAALLVLGSVFDKVFINDEEIVGGKFILLISKDDSESHSGRFKLKYGKDNTFTDNNGLSITNNTFFDLMRTQLGLSADACWFVSNINIEGQDKLILKTTIINKTESVEYYDTKALHSAWDAFCVEDDSDETSNATLDYSVEWFQKQAEKYMNRYNSEILPLYDKFKRAFSVDYIADLQGIDILNSLFINNMNSRGNLCYALEFDKDFSGFGSIKGGSSAKYGLYYGSALSSWTTGKGKSAKALSDEEAIALGTKIRDFIVFSENTVANTEFNSEDDYAAAYETIASNTEGYIDRMFVLKYLYMMHPDKLACFYSDKWQKDVLKLLGKNISDVSRFIRMGQINEFIKECGIPSWVFAQIIYNDANISTDDIEDSEDVEEEGTNMNPYIELNYTTSILASETRNRIFFGAPGTGKSHSLNEEVNTIIANGGDYERVTFHPDYTYANFVGTYKPVSKNSGIAYEYVPGPFMRVYVKAMKDARDNKENSKPHFLIIEEINRSNVAGTFGEVFQLLDRVDNVSEYAIQPSEDIKAFLASEKGLNAGEPDDYNEIKLPDNMFIWATMNSADQGVFPMDTAFKRRWAFKYLGINSGEKNLPKSDVADKWNRIRKEINEKLKKLKINEDKCLGPFFISKAAMTDETIFASTFQNKVIMYLFEDAVKQKRNLFFKKQDARYSDICSDYCKGEEIIQDVKLFGDTETEA